MNQKLTGATLLLVSAAAFLCVSGTTRREARMLFINGTVYTLDSRNTVAEAIAVRGGTIAGVGSTAELTKRFAPDTIVDLHGKTVMPGFTDAHAHMDGLGRLLESVILIGAPSPREVARLGQSRARDAAPGSGV